MAATCLACLLRGAWVVAELGGEEEAVGRRHRVRHEQAQAMAERWPGGLAQVLGFG